MAVPFTSKADSLPHAHAGIIGELRTFKAAVRAIIISQLTVMIKMILHFGTAFFTESSFSDLSGIFLIFEILLSNAKRHIRIPPSIAR